MAAEELKYRKISLTNIFSLGEILVSLSTKIFRRNALVYFLTRDGVTLALMSTVSCLNQVSAVFYKGMHTVSVIVIFLFVSDRTVLCASFSEHFIEFIAFRNILNSSFNNFKKINYLPFRQLKKNLFRSL